MQLVGQVTNALAQLHIKQALPLDFATVARVHMLGNLKANSKCKKLKYIIIYINIIK